jgi:hypothetical protein
VVGVDVVEVGYGEAALHDGFDIYFGLVEEGGDVLVLFHLVVAVFLPAMDGGAVPLHYYEVGVQKQNDVIPHFLLI